MTVSHGAAGEGEGGGVEKPKPGLVFLTYSHATGINFFSMGNWSNAIQMEDVYMIMSSDKSPYVDIRFRWDHAI